MFPGLGPSQDKLRYKIGLVGGVMCIHPDNAGARGSLYSPAVLVPWRPD